MGKLGILVDTVVTIDLAIACDMCCTLLRFMYSYCVVGGEREEGPGARQGERNHYPKLCVHVYNVFILNFILCLG
jgi:hypothetical protein